VVEDVQNVFIIVTHVEPEFQPRNSNSIAFSMESNFFEDLGDIFFL